MKILMINKFLDLNGGSEIYIYNLGAELVKRGHGVEYFGMDCEKRVMGNSLGLYTENMDFHSGGLDKILYPIRTVYSVEARKKLRKILDAFCPDVCHLNNFNYQLTPSVISEIVKWRKQTGRNCKIVYTAHDYQLICPNHMCRDISANENCEKCIDGRFINCTKHRCIHGSLAKSLVGTAEAAFWKTAGVYKYIDTVICCSKFIKEKLGHNPYFVGKTVLLQNFCEQDKKQKSDRKIGEYILYLGRVSREKGMKTLLDTAKKLPSYPFVIAGDGDMAEIFKTMPNVKCVGYVKGEEKEKLLAGARLTVYPSEWYENCPFSILESISRGVPVAASDIGGIPELVKDGVTGKLFTSGSAENFAAAIEEVWENAESMSLNCLNCRFLTLNEYTEKLLEIYGGQQVEKE